MVPAAVDSAAVALVKRIPAALLAIVLVAAAHLHAQPAAPSYRAVLEMYRAGDTDGAVAAAAHFTPEDIKKALKALVAEETRAKQAGLPRMWLRTAAMVHLECALLAERAVDARATDREASQMLIAAQFVRALSPDLRYETRTTLREEEPGSDAAFVRTWFRFIVAHEIGVKRWKMASEDIDRGLKETVSDPEILLAQGALHEVTWYQKHEEGRTYFAYSGDLGVAERALQAAVDAEPELDEARLRLGRVQGMRGEAAAALRTLAMLQPDRTEPGFLYLARLFEGDVQEAAGDLTAAERAYTTAMESMPAAQSAQIARAHVRHAMGRRDEVVREVTALAEGSSVIAATDPWLFYRDGVGWRAAGYLDALRAMVRP